MSQFRYLGFLRKGRGRDQAFLARGQELFIVGRDESVIGSIYLKELSSNYAILTETRTQVELTLNLAGE